MKKYAVALLLLLDNENKVFIVEAENEIQALHETYKKYNESHLNEPSMVEAIKGMPNDVEDFLAWCFDQELSLSNPVEI